MKNRVLFIVITVLLFSFTVNAQKIVILETGSFHGEEVSAKTGEMWLGLYKKNNSYALLPSVLSIQTVHDPVIDPKGEMSGKEVKVPGLGEPLFLIKGESFIQGMVVKSLTDKIVPITKDFSKTYTYKEQNYNLKVESGSKASKDKNFIQDNSKLVLTVGTKKQTLYSVKECSFCRWQVNWVGDLDSDGKLDFYMLLTNHYNVSNQKLFLSSKAEHGNLLKEVAEFTTTGC